MDIEKFKQLNKRLRNEIDDIYFDDCWNIVLKNHDKTIRAETWRDAVWQLQQMIKRNDFTIECHIDDGFKFERDEKQQEYRCYKDGKLITYIYQGYEPTNHGKYKYYYKVKDVIFYSLRDAKDYVRLIADKS